MEPRGRPPHQRPRASPALTHRFGSAGVPDSSAGAAAERHGSLILNCRQRSGTAVTQPLPLGRAPARACQGVGGRGKTGQKGIKNTPRDPSHAYRHLLSSQTVDSKQELAPSPNCLEHLG